MRITDDIRYIGVNDHQIDLFEGQYKVPNGMSYNSYVILDEKIAVLDTVDARFGAEWLEKLSSALAGRKPDYLIIQHMEPDHSANIARFAEAYPEAVLVGNAKTFPMLKNFFGALPNATHTVAGGETLSLGKHQLTFLFAPMVHWPEVMFTYDAADQVLFSADAFGKFGALDADEPWADEARRYYIGIVGKYGAQVQAVLKKAAALDIAAVFPLHGPVLTDTLPECLALYDAWSAYRPESSGVTIACAGVYGHTMAAARLLKEKLEAAGTEVELFDLNRDDMAAAVAAAFRRDRLVLASTTYNATVFPAMSVYLEELVSRNFQKRKIGLIENGSWAPTAAKTMAAAFEKSKEITLLEPAVKLLSALNAESEQQLDALCQALLDG